jgi:DNA modification methylase
MSYSLYHQDCLEMTGITNVRLVYLDPPYSCRGTSEDIYYGVGETFEEYLDYMTARLRSIKTVLHPAGANVVLHLDQKASHYLKVRGDAIFGRDNFRNEIAWCYSSPSVAKRWLPKKHDSLLWWGVGDYPFNQVRVPYVGKLKVGGKTAWSPDKDTDEYLERGKLLEDWWSDIPSLCRNEGERKQTGKYPTQKPLALMKRVVEAFSNENDLVMDCFMGSGSLLEAALNLKRNAVGMDINPEAIELVKKRLEKYDDQKEDTQSAI